MDTGSLGAPADPTLGPVLIKAGLGAHGGLWEEGVGAAEPSRGSHIHLLRVACSWLQTGARRPSGRLRTASEQGPTNFTFLFVFYFSAFAVVLCSFSSLFSLIFHVSLTPFSGFLSLNFFFFPFTFFSTYSFSF